MNFDFDFGDVIFNTRYMANLIIDMQAVRKTRFIGGNVAPSWNNNICIQT